MAKVSLKTLLGFLLCLAASAQILQAIYYPSGKAFAGAKLGGLPLEPDSSDEVSEEVLKEAEAEGEKAQADSTEHKCITCDWIPADGRRVLFAINNYVEWQAASVEDSLRKALARLESGPEQEGVKLEHPSDRATLAEMLRDLIFISKTDSCLDGEAGGKVATLEAILEEGEEPGAKVYKIKGLTRFLNEHHLRLFELCKATTKSKVAELLREPAIMSTYSTMLDLATKLNGAASRPEETNLESVWRVGAMRSSFARQKDLTKAKTEEERNVALFARGKTIMRQDWIFQKIEPIAVDFIFGAKNNLNARGCKAVVAKYTEPAAKLASAIHSMTYLGYYNPNIYNKHMGLYGTMNRDIFNVNKSFRKYLAANKDVAAAIELKKFIEATGRRVAKLCQQNS